MEKIFNEVFNSLKRKARLRSFDLKTSAWHLQDTDTPRNVLLQNNGVDSEVIVLWFAKRLSRGENEELIYPPFSASNFWQHINCRLREKVILGRLCPCRMGPTARNNYNSVGKIRTGCTGYEKGSKDPTHTPTVNPEIMEDSVSTSGEPSPGLSVMADERWLEDLLIEPNPVSSPKD